MSSSESRWNGVIVRRRASRESLRAASANTTLHLPPPRDSLGLCSLAKARARAQSSRSFRAMDERTGPLWGSPCTFAFPLRASTLMPIKLYLSFQFLVPSRCAMARQPTIE